MIERNYYSLVAGLPDLVPEDKKLPFSSVQLREYLEEELHPDDFKLAQLFYLPYDHANLMNLLFKQKKDWDERGNFPIEVLEQLIDRKTVHLLDMELLPAYFTDIADFLYEEEEELRYDTTERFITNSYYKHLLNSGNQFAREVATRQLNTGNIMLALNGRKHHLPFEESLLGKNEVTAALKKSRARDFGLSAEVPDIEELVQLFENSNILDRELKLDLHRWHYLDELTFFNYFSVERVIAFTLKLFIAERWFMLDKEKGQAMFKQLLNEIESSFQFPEEFTLTYGKKK